MVVASFAISITVSVVPVQNDERSAIGDSGLNDDPVLVIHQVLTSITPDELSIEPDSTEIVAQVSTITTVAQVSTKTIVDPVDSTTGISTSTVFS